MPTRMAISRWFRCLEGFSPQTIQLYRMILNRFLDAMPADIENITVEHIERYINSIARQWCNRTANSHLTAIKSFFRSLNTWYGYENVAAKVKMLREDPPRQRVLSEKEYQKVLTFCNPVERDVIEFLANTGLRKTEFQQLSWGNVTSDGNFLIIIGKGRKRRIVPLNQTCKQILKKYSNSTTHINFIKSYSKSRNSIYQFCKKLSRKANIPQFGPHALRHRFGSALYQKGVSLQKISKTLGHADTRTTEMIYCHIFDPKKFLLGVTDVLDS